MSSKKFCVATNRTTSKGNGTMHNPGESKYILQHLANERTYLNWIRSTVTVAGVFLGILRLVTAFQIPTRLHSVRELRVVCFIVLSFSLFSIIYSTSSYLRKRTVINADPRHAVSSSVQLTIASVIIAVCVVIFLLIKV